MCGRGGHGGFRLVVTKEKMTLESFLYILQAARSSSYPSYLPISVPSEKVHERDLQTDFLLVILRDLLPKRPDLSVVLMSATLQVSKAKYLSNVFWLDEARTVGLVSIVGF